MIKILLNCSTLVKGGSLQVASSVFEEAMNDSEITWYFAVTHTLYSKFEELLDPALKEGRVILLYKSPARSGVARTQLLHYAKECDFDVVFTLFGPSYVTFPMPHLCGIADGWVTHSNKEAYQSLNSVKEKIRTFMLCRYKLWWYKKADKWCVEAQVAKDGFLSKTHLKPESIVVIPNAVNQLVQKYATIKIERSLEQSINVFCLGADYWHKNYQIIPDIIVRLAHKIDYSINFIMTMPEDSPIYLSIMSKARQMKVADKILNLGSITVSEVVNAYKKYNILFFPSLLETFSITPLEALYMNMPMIVSNIQANTQVVGEYATYVDPLDKDDITEKFIRVISNYSEEVKKLHDLKDSDYFETTSSAAKRFRTYKSILETMVD